MAGWRPRGSGRKRATLDGTADMAHLTSGGGDAGERGAGVPRLARTSITARNGVSRLVTAWTRNGQDYSVHVCRTT
jgi:hypothetical protein